jgi:hypothetical protein
VSILRALQSTVADVDGGIGTSARRGRRKAEGGRRQAAGGRWALRIVRPSAFWLL